MLFVVPVVLFDMLKAKQLACVSESGQKCPAARSLSLRRAWIEICCINIIADSFRSLSLRRAWIEIARTWEPTRRPDGRSPYGERGLKYHGLSRHDRPGASLSLRRAWIEIARANASDGPSRSLSLRRAWIEITIRPFVIGWPCRSPYGERGLKFGAPAEPERDDASLSLRRAWIEISRSQAT